MKIAGLKAWYIVLSVLSDVFQWLFLNSKHARRHDASTNLYRSFFHVQSRRPSDMFSFCLTLFLVINVFHSFKCVTVIEYKQRDVAPPSGCTGQRGRVERSGQLGGRGEGQTNRHAEISLSLIHI